MAATHGAGEAPVAEHVGPSAARSQTREQLPKDPSRQRQGRSRVWIRETEVWGRRYDQVWNRKYEPYFRFHTAGIVDSILSIYARLAPLESTGLQSWRPTATSGLANDNFRVGDLVLWRRPGENRVLPSAGSTMRS